METFVLKSGNVVTEHMDSDTADCVPRFALHFWPRKLRRNDLERRKCDSIKVQHQNVDDVDVRDEKSRLVGAVERRATVLRRDGISVGMLRVGEMLWILRQYVKPD